MATGYYTPLPGQSFYLTGSYESEVILNGNGMYGADGTPVYAGMVAAPTTYALGTKLQLQGVGVAMIHDRGNAIVAAGVNGNENDRLDVWLGYGDAGLSRAIAFGKRYIRARVLPAGDATPVKIDLNNLQVEGSRPMTTNAVFAEADLASGDSGAEVVSLQQALFDIGLWTGDTLGTYDDATRQAIERLQIEAGIYATLPVDARGAYGHATREALRKHMKEYQGILEGAMYEGAKAREKIAQGVLAVKPGATNETIRLVAAELQRMGLYTGEPSATYGDEMRAAVAGLQQRYAVVGEDQSDAVGSFGPRTRRAFLNAMITERGAEGIRRQQDYRLRIQQTYWEKYQAMLAEQMAQPMVLPAVVLRPGSRGGAVSMVQQALLQLGVLRAQPRPGLYDDATAAGVAQLKLVRGIVSSIDAPGANVYDSSARRELQLLLGSDATSGLRERLAMQQQDYIRHWELLRTHKFVLRDLKKGERGYDVYALQAFLRGQGFFTEEPSGIYGDVTVTAVASFQRRYQLAAAAGRLDKPTRQKAMDILAEQHLASR